MRLFLEPVAVRSPATVAVALFRVLLLAAPDFAAELLDLELVERLEHVADQPALGARLVASGQRVEDLDAGPRHLALVGQRVEEVAAEPRSRVDDHRVEAASVSLFRLAEQFRPAGPIIASPRLLIGEVADDLAFQLGRFRRARLALRRKGERWVLLVLGREASVPGEAPHHLVLSGGIGRCGRYARAVTAKERLLREILDLDEAEAARARIMVPKGSETVALPEGWGETLTGEPMPDVAAAVRRSRGSD
jgi:hypothetical protein